MGIASSKINLEDYINSFTWKKRIVLFITKSKYIPKPSVEPLITYLNKNNINLKTCVYFEDLEKNLENAHKYGITTVHIEDKKNKKKTTQPFIDFRFKSILEALHTINKTYN